MDAVRKILAVLFALRGLTNFAKPFRGGFVIFGRLMHGGIATTVVATPPCTSRPKTTNPPRNGFAKLVSPRSAIRTARILRTASMSSGLASAARRGATGHRRAGFPYRANASTVRMNGTQLRHARIAARAASTDSPSCAVRNAIATVGARL